MRMAELISLLIVFGITITVVSTSPVPKKKPSVARSKQSKESKKECAAMEKLLKSDKVIHIKSTEILSGKLKEKVKTLAHVKSEVLKKRNILAIDLTDTKGTKKEKRFKDYFLKTFAIYFPVELIIISHHKSELMFTTIEDMKHPHFTESDDLERIFTYHEAVNADANNVSVRSDRVPGTANLPIIKFNWNFFREITELDDICTWESKKWRNSIFGLPDRYLCSERAGIALTLEVSAFRSMNDDTLAANIVDNKFIRITSIGAGGSGGFHLNDKLNIIEDEKEVYRNTTILGVTNIAVFRRKMSSMYASGYDIHIEAQGDNAFLKNSIPNSNVNKETAYSQESSQTIGVSAGVGVDKDGPSASLGIEASYTSSEAISFTLHDFDMIRDAGDKYINYLYKRNEKSVPTAATYDAFNAAIAKINPIGYASFVPKFDVAFVAEPGETGTTTFNVTTAMEASTFSMRKMFARQEGWVEFLSPVNYIDPEVSFSEKDHKLFNVTKLMQVDWSHAVFTGYRPVYLQSAYFDSKTFDVGENGEIRMNAPDPTELSQSFIYSSSGTYESVSKRGFCLDSSNLEQLQPCNSQQLTQRWYWEKDGEPDFQGVQRYKDCLDMKSGSTTKTRLAVNKVEGAEKGKLVMVDPNNENKDDFEDRFYTGTMNVFEQDWLRD